MPGSCTTTVMAFGSRWMDRSRPPTGVRCSTVSDVAGSWASERPSRSSSRAPVDASSRPSTAAAAGFQERRRRCPSKRRTPSASCVASAGNASPSISLVVRSVASSERAVSSPEPASAPRPKASSAPSPRASARAVAPTAMAAAAGARSRVATTIAATPASTAAANSSAWLYGAMASMTGGSTSAMTIAAAAVSRTPAVARRAPRPGTSVPSRSAIAAAEHQPGRRQDRQRDRPGPAEKRERSADECRRAACQ